MRRLFVVAAWLLFLAGVGLLISLGFEWRFAFLKAATIRVTVAIILIIVGIALGVWFEGHFDKKV